MIDGSLSYFLKYMKGLVLVEDQRRVHGEVRLHENAVCADVAGRQAGRRCKSVGVSVGVGVGPVDGNSGTLGLG